MVEPPGAVARQPLVAAAGVAPEAAGDASPPVRVTVKASEVSAKKLFGASLACRPSARTTVALPPGKSTTACTLTFSRPNVVARKAGKLNLVFSVACARSHAEGAPEQAQQAWRDASLRLSRRR